MTLNGLILHTGASRIDREALDQIIPPPATSTWHPISHSAFLETSLATLDRIGFAVADQQLAVARDGHRFFATLRLASPVAPGVGLAVGLRNSTDKSFPYGFAAGSSVMVCDNLSFSAELVVRRKHTVNGAARFAEAIQGAVDRLDAFRIAEQERVIWMRETELGRFEADSLILGAYERGVISSKILPDVVREWREPRHPEFAERTRWSLMNAFTEALKPVEASNPARFLRQTMTLNALLGRPDAASVPIVERFVDHDDDTPDVLLN